MACSSSSTLPGSTSKPSTPLRTTSRTPLVSSSRAVGGASSPPPSPSRRTRTARAARRGPPWRTPVQGLVVDDPEHRDTVDPWLGGMASPPPLADQVASPGTIGRSSPASTSSSLGGRGGCAPSRQEGVDALADLETAGEVQRGDDPGPQRPRVTGVDGVVDEPQADHLPSVDPELTRRRSTAWCRAPHGCWRGTGLRYRSPPTRPRADGASPGRRCRRPGGNPAIRPATAIGVATWIATGRSVSRRIPMPSTSHSGVYTRSGSAQPRMRWTSSSAAVANSLIGAGSSGSTPSSGPSSSGTSMRWTHTPSSSRRQPGRSPGRRHARRGHAPPSPAPGR